SVTPSSQPLAPDGPLDNVTAPPSRVAWKLARSSSWSSEYETRTSTRREPWRDPAAGCVMWMLGAWRSTWNEVLPDPWLCARSKRVATTWLAPAGSGWPAGTVAVASVGPTVNHPVRSVPFTRTFSVGRSRFASWDWTRISGVAVPRNAPLAGAATVTTGA